MPNDKKPLTQCTTEAERRAYYPELCRIADVIQQSREPEKLLQAIAYIITRRRKEQNEYA